MSGVAARAAIRSEAAHWFSLRQSGDMTVEDEQCFRDWLARSLVNQDAYAQIDRGWEIAGAAALDADIVALRESVGREPVGREFAGREPVVVERDCPSRRWRLLAVAASVLLLVTMGWGVFHNGIPGFSRPQPQQVFRTGSGQRAIVTLPDGSVVTLDAETEMRLREKPRERLVELIAGRAFFRVSRDPSRPFIVTAGEKRVRAIGTAFEVRFEHGNMMVTLAEGKVRVEDAADGPGNSTDMVPGGQLAIGADRNWTLSRVDVGKETSWTQGRLIFMHDNLSDAIAEMNRYASRKLVFKGDHVPDRQIVGVFEAGDVDGFVKAMEMNGIAHRVSTSNEEILLSATP